MAEMLAKKKRSAIQSIYVLKSYAASAIIAIHTAATAKQLKRVVLESSQMWQIFGEGARCARCFRSHAKDIFGKLHTFAHRDAMPLPTHIPSNFVRACVHVCIYKRELCYSNSKYHTLGVRVQSVTSTSRVDDT